MMKKKLKIILSICFLLFSCMMNAQILITLLFGEKLNTPKIEFGLQGGMTRSYINDIENSNGMNQFALGFYFHFMLKNSSFLSTGVSVKSTYGATGMPTYSMNDASFDTIFQNGTLTKKINYFYLPVMFHQRFNNFMYIEAGPQFGLRYKATDIFEESALNGDVTFTRNVKDEYKALDAGLVGGIGFKFKRILKSMSLGVSYYYGLVNVSKLPDVTIKNSGVYFFVKQPIGLGGGDKKKEE
ncbi:MAG: porin family protein [Bacteroidales bacterium]